MNDLTTLNVRTMSSKEIAELTGKLHKNVIVDVENIIRTLSQSSDFSFAIESTTYTEKVGFTERNYKMYNLDYEATMVLLTGYSIELRAVVVKRWQELEKQQSNAINRDSKWHEVRNTGKQFRLSETDAIQSFVAYATGQGSKSAKMYYMNITMMVNKALFNLVGKLPKGKTWRDYMRVDQLGTVKTFDNLVKNELIKLMDSGIFYKRIYKEVRDKVHFFAESIDKEDVVITEIKKLTK